MNHLASVLAATCALITATPMVSAQEPTSCPDTGGLFAAYDVVSLKPVHPDRIMSTAVSHRPDGIDGESVTVEMLVRSSYAYTFTGGKGNFVNDDVITGLPDWAKKDYFSLEAKMSPEQVAVFAKLDGGQQRACQDNMEQALLRDRFRLKIHRQPRQVLAYELVVANGGPKFKESPGPDPNAPNGPDGKPQTMRLSGRQSPDGPEIVLHAYSMPIQQLTNLLMIYSAMGVNHTVVDRTGLTGTYSFNLAFRDVTALGSTNAAASNPGSSIFTALEDQLGLRLQRTTLTFDTVVVDQVERPSEN